MSKRKPDPPVPAPSLDELMRPWKERRDLGGSQNGYVNCQALNDVLSTRWRPPGEDAQGQEVRERAAVYRLAGIAPRDVIEGMLAAQLVATHGAAMECFRRAHLPDQDGHGHQLCLGHATRLVRSFAALSEALDRHRGKGQQVVRVEHVTVQAGGQAIVGTVSQGGGDGGGSDERSHAKGSAALAHAPECPLRCPDPQGDPVPLARGER
jgi:hypothetical protein